jgi:hypothetical protein
VEAETRRPDIGRIASREHSPSRWYRGDGSAVFDSFSKIWMDFLFDITAGKTVFFCHFYPGELPRWTYHKVIIFFSFIPNSGMKAFGQVILLADEQ